MDHIRAFGRYFCAPFSIERMQPLAEKLADRRLGELKVETISENDRKLTRLRYFRSTSMPSDEITVDLDPDLGWVILGARVRYSKIPGGVSFKARYDPDRLHWPVPSWVEYIDPDMTVTRYEFRKVEFESTPAEEFSPVFYGLPDLPGTPKSSALPHIETPNLAHADVSPWWRSPLFFGMISLASVGLVASYFLGRIASSRKGSIYPRRTASEGCREENSPEPGGDR